MLLCRMLLSGCVAIRVGDAPKMMIDVEIVIVGAGADSIRRSKL